jgi:hypothetical protein
VRRFGQIDHHEHDLVSREVRDSLHFFYLLHTLKHEAGGRSLQNVGIREFP